MNNFTQLVSNEVLNQSFAKLSIVNPINKEGKLKNVNVKVIKTKKGTFLSFGYKNKTNYITKNLQLDEALDEIKNLLNNHFLQATLFTLTADYYLTKYKNGALKVNKKAPTITEKPSEKHNRIKERIIGAENKNYLYELGITTANGEVKNSKSDKYKQINKYVELFDGILKNNSFNKEVKIVDMGSGKGYLTFALYDYLQNTIKLNPTLIGVEMRPDLIEKCNIIAKKSDFKNLHFEKGTILDYSLNETDVLVALHACDTATDDAIYKGIIANARIIVCAPCCHKQIRKAMSPKPALNLITKHGILKERQAEILTDTMRALIMEYHGYTTKVFEFIATEHTPKNVLIVGTKRTNFVKPEPKIWEQFQSLKKEFGVKEHYLEGLLK